MIVIMRPAGRLACSTACDSIYSCSLSAGAIVVWAPGWDGVVWYGMVWSSYLYLPCSRCVHSQMSALSSSAPHTDTDAQRHTRPQRTPAHVMSWERTQRSLKFMWQPHRVSHTDAPASKPRTPPFSSPAFSASSSLIWFRVSCWWRFAFSYIFCRHDQLLNVFLLYFSSFVSFFNFFCCCLNYIMLRFAFQSVTQKRSGPLVSVTWAGAPSPLVFPRSKVTISWAYIVGRIPRFALAKWQCQ